MISYFTWVGFLVALVIGDRTDSFTNHHLNQALVINILSIAGGVLSIIPLLGTMVAGIIDVVVVIFWIMGIYRAITWSMEPLPLLGDIHLIG